MLARSRRGDILYRQKKPLYFEMDGVRSRVYFTSVDCVYTGLSDMPKVYVFSIYVHKIYKFAVVNNDITPLGTYNVHTEEQLTYGTDQPIDQQHNQEVWALIFMILRMCAGGISTKSAEK